MTRKGWVWLGGCLISGFIATCFVPAKAQVKYCYTLGADMAQCTDGTFALGLGQGDVLINTPPDLSVPQSTTNAYFPPLLTIPELVAAAIQAKKDCFSAPGPLNTCAKRNDIEAELYARGMCFGSSGKAMADSDWLPCRR